MANEDVKSLMKEAKASYKASKNQGEINKDAVIDVESDDEQLDDCDGNGIK